MAYRRSRRTYRKRSGGYRRRQRRPNIQSVQFPSVGNMSLGQMARYGATGYNILKGLINSEMKRFDVSGSAGITTTPSIVLLSGVAQGNDADQRDGNKILGKYIRFQYYCAMNVSATSTAVRVMVFVDTQQEGDTIVGSEVLQTTSAGLAINSPLSIDNTQRFTVLFDDRITMSNTGNSISDRKRYRALNFHISFTGSAGSTQNKNSIYLLALSTEATNAPTLVYNSRLCFYDN